MRRAAHIPVIAALALSACGSRDVDQPLSFEQPATAVAYTVEMTGAPNDAVDALMRESLGVFRRQEDGAQSLAFLRRRARDDVAIATRILRSYGWYQPEIEVSVREVAPAASDASPSPAAPGGPAEGAAPAPTRAQALATIAIDPGPRFTLARHGFVPVGEVEGPALALDAAALGSPVGGPAEAAGILAAEAAAVAGLRNAGRPYAETRGRDAVADLERREIEVDTSLAPGPYLVFGDAQFEGLRRVDAEYLLTYQTWTPGEPFDARKLRAFQQALVETGLFAAISAAPPETPPESGAAAPVVVRAEEGKRRTATAGARFNTDSGPAVRGSFEHRNMFGANETIRLEATAGLEEQEAEARYTEPQFLRPGQDFVAGFGLRHTESDAFDEYAATVTAGLERDLSDRWRVGAGGLAQASVVDDGTEETTFLLFGLPFFARYDGSDDALNPSRGARLNLTLTPFTGAADQGPRPQFLRFDGLGSVYQALDAEARYVLAGRARLGSIATLEDDGVPANQRLYSGGGGSVRGYGERDIGPLDESGDPTGGLSVAELGAELRAVVWGPVGAAAFVEAGTVSDAQFPDFDEGVQYAAGGGVRYLSPVGPIRLDVGVPLNPRDRGDNFQIYLSIGQAF